MSAALAPPTAPRAERDQDRDRDRPAPRREERFDWSRFRPGRLYLTEPDYWRFLETSERPHEWKCGLGLYEDGAEVGEVRPVSGYEKDGSPALPTFNHAKLVREWLVRLDALCAAASAGGTHEAVSEGVAVRLASGRLRYPDLVVAPTPPQFEPHPAGRQLVLVNPAMLIEILSDSTETEDLTVKLGDYATIPTVTDYLIAAQDQRLVLHYRRPAGSAPADGWHVTRHAGAEAAVTLTEPAAELSLGELYARVIPAG